MLRLNRHGTREMLVGAVLLIALAVGLGYLWWPLALVPIPVLVWLFSFFRDPERALPSERFTVVSPADGLVTDVTEIASEPLLDGAPAVRVGIFLSVFNVHVNRAPADGKVVAVEYKTGTFKSALRHDECSTDNESNACVLADPVTGVRTFVVRQIAGLIARRIIFEPKVGDLLERGQRIGLIKFGSRTELTINRVLNPELTVKVGQKVRGGADVIARLGTPANAIAAEPMPAAMA